MPYIEPMGFILFESSRPPMADVLSQDLAGDVLHRRLRGRAQALAALAALARGGEEERGGRGGAALQP